MRRCSAKLTGLYSREGQCTKPGTVYLGAGQFVCAVHNRPVPIKPTPRRELTPAELRSARIRLEVLQEFAEVGAHDRMGDRKDGVWGQWMTPDVAKMAAISKNAYAAAERYRTEPAVRLDQARRYRETRSHGMRKKLDNMRGGLTRRFTLITKDPNVEGETIQIKGYITTGEYEDGKLGEIFVKIGKPGSSTALLDEWAKAFSMALQHGAPLEVLCAKHIFTRFEPSGPTDVPEVPRCTSLTDLVCRWLLARYGKVETAAAEVES